MSSRRWAPICLCLCFPSIAAGGSPITVHRDIEYVRYGDVRLALDAAIPQTGAPPPAVIVVHGGGWVRGDRRVDVEPLLQPLSDAGFAWFSISYRLMNDVMQFGAAVDDVAAAIRFVKAHAAQYHVDPERIALVGESAGGQLAAMAALTVPDIRVKGVVCLYAPTDLASLAKNSTYVPQWIRDNVKGTPWEGLLLARLKQLSPIEYVRREMPPFLLIHGAEDKLVPFAQSRAMCDRMTAAGASCELYPVEGAGHGVRWWGPSSNGYKREMVRWLNERLTPSF
jgi:acetyl esterase